jgi:AcrR family transcriptional regulator
MGRPREHDDVTRAALLAAAEELLARGGADALAVRAVADAVGTTTRAVYTVFGGKRGLIGALWARGMGIIAGLLETLPSTDDPAADLVAVGTDGFRRFAIEHPNLFRLTFERLVADFVPGDAERAAARVSIGRLRERVKRCQAAGLLADRDPVAVAWQFHAFCQGLASIELQGWLPPGMDGAAFWREALAAFVSGAARPRPARRGAGAAAAGARSRPPGSSPRSPGRSRG